MNGIDDCTKDILQELQQEDHIDSDNESWNSENGQDNCVKLTLTLIKELYSRVCTKFHETFVLRL